MDALLGGPSWSEIAAWLPDFWAGFVLSVELTVFSLLIGLPLGLAFALGVKAPSSALRIPAFLLVELGRGAPALVLLQFMYFGLPSAGMPLSAFAAATVALSWSTGAYSSEIIRAGLDSVAAGQREACLALGLNRRDAYRFVLLPQGLRVATPALMGLAILLFQGTSLCFAISLPEMISRAYAIGASTFHYFTALAIVGLFFAAVCIPAAFLVSWVERRAGTGSRNRG